MEETLNELQEIKNPLRIIAQNAEQDIYTDYSDFEESVSSVMSNLQSVE